MVEIDHLLLPGYQPVSLQIDAGDCIGISGASGSGKTRLLRAIADMDDHQGEIYLDGVVSTLMPASKWRKKVALLPAESVWWFDRIGEHFQSYNDYFSALGFTEEVMGWESVRCSSGEKQRLSIIRLLENKPVLLLLDEPTANLDQQSSRQVEVLIQRYLATRSASAIWVAHAEPQLQRMAQRRFIMMDNGLQPVTT